MSQSDIVEHVKRLAHGAATYADVVTAVSVEDVIEASPDGVVLVNEDGYIIYTNKRARSMFRYPSGSLIGKPVEILIPKHLASAHQAHRANFNKSPEPRMMGRGMVLEAERMTGEVFRVEVSLNPVFTPAGAVTIANVREVISIEQSKESTG